jgi:type VI secretion system protein ImpB
VSDSAQKFVGRNRAPRVQIEYDTEVYGSQKKVELPFVMAVMADLKGKAQEGEEVLPASQREFEEVEAGTLDSYMAGTKPRATFHVDNKLSDEGGQMPVDLTFTSMEDFSPARIAEQVGPLKELLDARNQLKSLLSLMDGRLGAEKLIEDVLKNKTLLESLKDMSPEEVAAKFGKDDKEED